jgi:hypothetical protein
MAEDFLAKQLTNKINGPKAEHAEEWDRLERGLKSAMMGHYNAQTRGLNSTVDNENSYQNALSGGTSSGSSSGNLSLPAGGGVVREGNGSGYIGPQTPGSGQNNYANETVQSGMTPSNYGGGDWAESDRGQNPNGFDVGPMNNEKITPSTAEQTAPIESFESKIKQAVAAPSNAPQILIEGDRDKEHLNKMFDDPRYHKQMVRDGFKKTQTIKLDPKTGRTSIVTTYPNGKVELFSPPSTIQGTVNEPLTTTMKNTLQQAVASTDKIIPKLEALANETPPSNYDRASGNDNYREYRAKVVSLLDDMITAKKWSKTDTSLAKAEEMLNIGMNQSSQSYKRQLKEIISDLGKSQTYDRATSKAGYILPQTGATPRASGANPPAKVDVSKWKVVGE